MKRTTRAETAVLGLVLGAMVAAGCATTRTVGRQWDDELLTRRIENGLAFSDQTSAFDVDVKAYEGNVVLVGEVDDETSKQTAEMIAQAVPGVRNVENRLVVEDEAAERSVTSDAWITTKINTLYTFDGDVKARNIGVKTVDGVVYLTGIAESEAEKQRAEGVARFTGGVRDVQNLVEVAGAADR